MTLNLRFEILVRYLPGPYSVEELGGLPETRRPERKEKRGGQEGNEEPEGEG